MPGEYRVESLHLLKVLRDKKELRGTAYFEFHPKNLQSEYSSWNEGSIYLADAGFDYFCECFYKSNREFDYFAFCKYNGDEIASLIVEIDRFLSELKNDSGRKTVFSRFSGLFGKEMWDNVDEKKISEVLISTGKELIRFFKDAKSESGILWVLGM